MNDLVQNAQNYAARHQLALGGQLGFGIHGTVFRAKNNFKPGETALKASKEIEPFLRERDVYQRLMASNVTEIQGLNVPQLIRFDNELRVIEMTIVDRPYILDFAGAYMGRPKEFSDEIWSERLVQAEERFGERWKRVLKILDALEALGIYLGDISPSNIAFLD